jgi:hypothetical protein
MSAADRRGLSAADIDADASAMRDRADLLLRELSDIDDAELSAGHARMYPKGCPARACCQWCWARLGPVVEKRSKPQRTKFLRGKRAR